MKSTYTFTTWEKISKKDSPNLNLLLTKIKNLLLLFVVEMEQ